MMVGAHNLSAKRSPHGKCSKLPSVVMGIHNLSAIRLPCSEHSELASILNAVNATNSHHWWWGPKTWAQKSLHTSNFSHAANLAMQRTQQMLWGSKFLRGTFSYLNIDGDAPHHYHHLLCMWRTCRAMKTKGMVFRYTWVYSKEDTMAHTCRLVVTS